MAAEKVIQRLGRTAENMPILVTASHEKDGGTQQEMSDREFLKTPFTAEQLAVMECVPLLAR
jgi:hypothetical protein